MVLFTPVRVYPASIIHCQYNTYDLIFPVPNVGILGKKPLFLFLLDRYTGRNYNISKERKGECL